MKMRMHMKCVALMEHSRTFSLKWTNIELR